MVGYDVSSLLGLSVWNRYEIPDSVKLDLLESCCGAVDSEGFAAQVALYSLMFFYGTSPPVLSPYS